MRVTSKGQVTIPVGIRERFGFLPDTEVEFVVEGARSGSCVPRARRRRVATVSSGVFAVGRSLV